MQPIGPIGKLQDLNLRDGDFVVCVESPMSAKNVIVNSVYGFPFPSFPWGRVCAFQRLHHHDPRCFGFEEKTTSKNEVQIHFFADESPWVIRGASFSGGQWCGDVWCGDGNSPTDGEWGRFGNLIPLTPPTEYEVLGHRFATRKEAEDAMEIKEVLK